MRHKFSKNLYTHKSEGSLPQLVIAESEYLQSKFVVQKILELREGGIPLHEIAVLFRSSFLSFDLEIELTKANIPFVKYGGFKFIETAHVKDMIAYLRVLENPKDVVAWNRILLLIEGVGPRSAGSSFAMKRQLQRMAHAATTSVTVAPETLAAARASKPEW